MLSLSIKTKDGREWNGTLTKIEDLQNRNVVDQIVDSVYRHLAISYEVEGSAVFYHHAVIRAFSEEEARREFHAELVNIPTNGNPDDFLITFSGPKDS